MESSIKQIYGEVKQINDEVEILESKTEVIDKFGFTEIETERILFTI